MPIEPDELIRLVEESLAQSRSDLLSANTANYISTAINVKLSREELVNRASYIAHLETYSWSAGYCDRDLCEHRRDADETHCTGCVVKREEQNVDMSQSIRIEVTCPRCHMQHFDVEPSQINELICTLCNQGIVQTMVALHEAGIRMKAQEEENNVE